MGKKLKGTYVRGFSLKKECRPTVALTKYLISASPGKPLSVGGSVLWTCLVGVLGISRPKFETPTFEIVLF